MLDTRDLLEEREALKQDVLDSFLETFPHYEEMTDNYEDIRFEEEEIRNWKEDHLDSIERIAAIESLEDEIGSEFSYGVTLIEDNEWGEYVEELVTDCGYITRDFPSWIIIDWDKTAVNVHQDYSGVEFDGVGYSYRV